MENLIKEKYETPTTQRTRVEMESGICVASDVDVNQGDDVNTNRHVNIDAQGFDDTSFGGDNAITSWDKFE